MKVLLINPYRDIKRYIPGHLRQYVKHTPSLFENYSVLPLDMAYLGAILKQEHEVDLIDAHIMRMQAEEIDFSRYQCVVANTAPYSHWRCFQTFFQHTLDVVSLAEKAGCRTIVYGPHPTVEPQSFESADCVILGEPDDLIMEAINTDSKVIGPKMENELDRYPPLAYELFDFSLYQSQNCYVFDCAPFGKVGTLTSSRGCPYNCAFCFRGLATRNTRFHSLERTLDAVDRLVNHYQCKALFWEDLVFNLDKKRLLELCKGLERFKVPYAIQARIDLVDEEVARALADSGCYKIMFGVEAGDDSVLEELDKGFEWKQVKNAITICKKAGIPKVVGFAGLFAPGETMDSLKRTVRNFESLGLPLFFNIWFPFPLTTIYKKGVQEGLLSEERVEWDKLLMIAGTIGNDFSRRKVNSVMRKITLRDRYLRYKKMGPREIWSKACRKLTSKIGLGTKKLAEGK